MRTRTGRCVLDDLGLVVASVVFGVDGVIVDSARASAAAWKTVLDAYLRTQAMLSERSFVPFDVRVDYLGHIHGRTPLNGARHFLASRDVVPSDDDLRALAARQDDYFLGEVRRHGLMPFVSSVLFVRELHRCGVPTAAVSTRRHGVEMLTRAGVSWMFDVLLDGLDAPGAELPDHPDARPFVQAALRLDAAPGRTAVVEESVAGVTAASAGGFGAVVGIDRTGGSARLAEHGADLVIADLSELRLRGSHAA